jgi:hypothetical protein
MYFQETTGDPEARAFHQRVQAEGRGALGALLGEQIGDGDPLGLEMAAEVIRAGLTGLAIWWIDHPEVPRERIVETAINTVWIGLRP